MPETIFTSSASFFLIFYYPSIFIHVSFLPSIYLSWLVIIVVPHRLLGDLGIVYIAWLVLFLALVTLEFVDFYEA